MTDVRKVISQFNHPSPITGSNFVKSPEGDRTVFYNRLGFLETDYPLVKSTVKEAIVGNADAAKQNANAHILSGNYFSAGDITLQPSDFDFRRFIIRVSGQAAVRTWTFPDPATTINYLKTAFGRENIVAGLCWAVHFFNDNGAGVGITLRVTVPGGTQAVQTYGFNGAGPFTRDVNAKTSTTIYFILTNVADTFEAITYYALN